MMPTIITIIIVLLFLITTAAWGAIIFEKIKGPKSVYFFMITILFLGLSLILRYELCNDKPGEKIVKNNSYKSDNTYDAPDAHNAQSNASLSEPATITHSRDRNDNLQDESFSGKLLFGKIEKEFLSDDVVYMFYCKENESTKVMLKTDTKINTNYSDTIKNYIIAIGDELNGVYEAEEIIPVTDFLNSTNEGLTRLLSGEILEENTKDGKLIYCRVVTETKLSEHEKKYVVEKYYYDDSKPPYGVILNLVEYITNNEGKRRDSIQNQLRSDDDGD